MKNSKKGFTLIELLVVVLIIGVLAAIALPQYNRAVARSRFNALMPITKAMADANEAYYLEHNSYASNPQDLPVEGKTEYPTGTELAFGTSTDYAYVLASNPSVKNNYIVYQKHSANYPGEIHCEAEEGNAQAEYICESAGATKNIGNILTEGYTTYVLSGDGVGFPPGYNALLAQRMDCTGVEAAGVTCNVTTNEEGKQVKQMCINGVCRTKTFNEDGSYTSVTCKSDGSKGENVCTSGWRSVTYDANGNMIAYRTCQGASYIDDSGNCTAYSNSTNDNVYDYTYDANGNMLTKRNCSQFDSQGNCTRYTLANAYNYTYDANGNQIAYRQCNQMNLSTGECTGYSYGTDYIFDDNGNKIAQRGCSSIDSSGTCTAYNSTAETWTYDENGNMLAYRRCNSFDSSGNCTGYYGSGIFYTYDANGNQISERSCGSVDSSGICTQYNTYNAYDYTYDANGNKTSERYCKTMDSSGACTEYNPSFSHEWSYDDNGRMLSYRYCNSMDSSGNCTVYSTTYNYTYDANGNQLTERNCQGSMVGNNGICTSYNKNGHDYTYDANGNQLTSLYCGSIDSSGNCTTYDSRQDSVYDDTGKALTSTYCNGSNINTATGECIAYNNINTQYY